ncbi:phage tail tape measure protein [Parabacteroides sp. AM08-6]|uniref:phage tail tape measure protein n=1 Tax=Parabacteroides sp. AM08-6 TaxID=2292053 RepID=UPI000F0086C0|nr:phage tail tape measure protein [Parabacteroides sp. AM08-6]RHJ83554.1 phage tail tape measure protein [Parabacteroides sp. AM08-6]
MANDLNRSIKIYLDNSDAMTSAGQLEDRMGELEKKLLALQTAGKGNTEQAKKLQKELTAQTQKYEKYKREVSDTERVLRNLSGATYKELLAAKKQVDLQLRSTTRNTDLYNKRLEVQKAISKELILVQKDMRTEIGCQASSWGRAADFINKYMGIIGTVVAGVTGVTMAFNKLREARNKLEESKADVKALTGLDDESVEWLTAQAKQLSTTVTKEGIRIRQSATEILEAYKLVGSAKPELLANKEALAAVTEQTLILASASGMKLTDAVDAVTLALNQYGAGADEAAKYVNVLAAGSKYGAAAVESQTSAIKKSGVAAASANIPIEQLVGTIETLAEKGIKDEIAGTGLKKFFLTLQTGADETNPKVVGLEKALENLSKKQMDAATIKKMFGEEGYNVASVLINETDKVKKYTEAVTGTSVAMEQAGVKSDTAASKLDQARNKMTDLGVELMEKLNPAITGALNKTVNWTRKIVLLADWISKNTGLIVSLGVTLATYTVVVQTIVNWERIRNRELVIFTKLGKTWTLVTTTMKGAQIALAGAYALLTGNLVRAKAAWALLNSTMLLNPIVAIGVAVAALAVGIYKLATRTTDAKEAMASFMESSIKEQTELEKLYGALKRSGEGTEQRTKLIKEFNSKYGEYLPNLLSEKSTLEEIKTAYENVTVAMRENIAQKTLEKKTEKIETDSLEKKTKELNDIKEKLSALPKSMIADAISDIVSQVEEGKNQGKELGVVWRDVIENIRKVYFDNGSLPARFGNELDNYVREVYKAADKVKAVKEELSPFLPKEKEKQPEPTDPTNGGVVITASVKDKTSTPTSDEEQKKITDAKLKEVDRYVQQEKVKLKESYLQNLMDKADYNRQLEMLELESLNRRLAIYGLDKDKQAEIQDKILSYKVKILEETKKFEESQEKYRLKAEKKEEKTKEKALNDELKRVVTKNQEQKKIEYDKEMEHRKKMVELAQGFSSEIGTIVGSALSGNSDIVKSSLVAIINMGLDALKIQCEMAAAGATMQSLAQADSVLTFGAAGFARAAILVGLIEAAFSAVKSVVGNLVNNIGNNASSSDISVNGSSLDTGTRVVNDGFYLGGDTGKGSPFAVAGPVHYDEYVVPSFVLHEPAAMNHVAALEAMRRQKTNANPLSLPVAGFANGGYAGNQDTTISPVVYPDNSKDAINKLDNLLNKLDRDGIKAYIIYSEYQKVQKQLEESRKIGSKS